MYSNLSCKILLNVVISFNFLIFFVWILPIFGESNIYLHNQLPKKARILPIFDKANAFLHNQPKYTFGGLFTIILNTENMYLVQISCQNWYNSILPSLASFCSPKLKLVFRSRGLGIFAQVGQPTLKTWNLEISGNLAAF